MSSPGIKQSRFLSRNGLDIVAKPSQYFNSYSLMTGSVNYKGAIYSLKKIDLKEDLELTELPEVQIVNLNYSNPYLIRYYDYVLEQDYIDGAWVNRAVYILMENSDYDLKTYIMKYGPLSLENILKLTESLVGANYYLQKEIKIAHGDIRLQNIRIILNQTSGSQKNDQLTFKLSYFDDILRANNSHSRNKKDSLSYMAPELLSSSIITSSYCNQTAIYTPSEELQNLIAECADELRYDPFRADVFSAGLTIFSAATGIIFTLNNDACQPFEVLRDGRTEIPTLNKSLRIIKNRYQCPGLSEIIRIMTNQNPLFRYDFEELAVRMNKIRNLNPAFPEVELVREESNLRQEHDLLKENYWELQEMLTEIKDRESEYQHTIESLKEQLQRTNVHHQNTSYGKLYPHIPLTDLSAITPVDDDNLSFLSSASNSPRKALGALISNEKDAFKGLELKNTLVDQAQQLLNATNTTRETTATSYHKPHYSNHSYKKGNHEDKKYYKRKR